MKLQRLTNLRWQWRFGLRRVAGAERGFTLVEVILAIGIATGLLVVALVFYNQAANLRSQLIDEAERLSAVRLLMDRMAADLRCAFPQAQVGFAGTIDSMVFVTTRAPEASALRAGPPASASDGAGSSAPLTVISGGVSTLGPMPGQAAVVPGSELRRLSYFLTARLEGTNFVVTGFDRTEETLAEVPGAAATSTTTTAAGGAAESGGESGAATASGGTNSVGAAAAVTTSGGVSGTNAAGPAVAGVSEPLAEIVKFARFRYWDGSAWLEAWDAPDLPRAVEVSLGFDPLPEGELPDDYPFEQFRRVILLPASREVAWWSEF